MEPEKKTPRERAEDLVRLLVPNWRPSARQGLWAFRIVLAIVVVLGLLTVVGQSFGITLWDWLKLLVVPAVIAAGGLWFNRQQREREMETARQQREQELSIAERRTQDEALQAYLDQMSDMLIPNKDQPSLYDESPPGRLRAVARARTLSVLPRLAGDGKEHVVRFLYEAGLIRKRHTILDLGGERDMSSVNLRWGADLRGASLSRVNLSGANLGGVNLIGAYLNKSSLKATHLSRADLSGADLSGANLSGANLSSARLSGANLSGADLSGAKLVQAAGWTAEQLDQAKSLKGATMPNGQKYEDWLKSKGGREDG